MDQRLRELERRWRSSGATDDAAAWLAERLRREPALQARVAIAAHAGDPAACGALGQLASPTDPLVAWTLGLAGISRAGAVAAALGVVRVAFFGPARVEWGPSYTRTQWSPGGAVLGLQEWLLDPSGAATEVLRALVVEAGRAEGTLRYYAERGEAQPLPERLAAARLSVAAGAVSRAVQVAYEDDPGWLLAEAISRAAIATRGPLTSLRHVEAMTSPCRRRAATGPCSARSATRPSWWRCARPCRSGRCATSSRRSRERPAAARARAALPCERRRAGRGGVARRAAAGRAGAA